MIRRKLTYYLLTLLALAAIPACSADDPDMPGRQPQADTYLKLSVSTVEAPSPASRAGLEYPVGEYPDGYEYGFEGPATEFEIIRTMRFIVVDQNGSLESNVFIDPKSASTTATATCKVKPSEWKTIYLIGNEASLPDDVRKKLEDLNYGDEMPTDILSQTLTRSSGEALYTAEQGIPLTEIHRMYVGSPRYDADGNQLPWSKNLFVTRAATKFVFTVKTDTEEVAAKHPIDLKISRLTISGIATSEYLFPTATVYDPSKEDNTELTKRIIKSYKCPDDVMTESYTFTPANFGLSFNVSGTPDKYTDTYAPAIYLPESPEPVAESGADKYKLTVDVILTEDSQHGIAPRTLTLGPAELPNLPSLPRNTCVKVEMTFKDHNIELSATVLPYTGVNLKPNFGIER